MRRISVFLRLLADGVEISDGVAVRRGGRRPCLPFGIGRQGRLPPHLAVSFLVFAFPLALRAADIAPRMLLLDAARGPIAVVAVGERGAILRSTNNGRTWQPAASPTRATLTGIAFAPTPTTPNTIAPIPPGWAVGHDALILATTDGGGMWTKQYQGENLQDSFLDVLALDTQRVIAVGAYGLYVSTNDGGRTWTKRKLGDDDYHFNRLSRGPTGTLYLAGERGTLLRSADDGATWTPIRAPYEGSFYGVLPLDRRLLLAHGLRGHVYRSNDDGATWTQLAIAQPVLFAASVKLRSNIVLLGGHARALLVSQNFGASFAPLPQPLTTAVAELLELPDGNVLAVGEAGATVIAKPQ